MYHVASSDAGIVCYPFDPGPRSCQRRARSAFKCKVPHILLSTQYPRLLTFGISQDSSHQWCPLVYTFCPILPPPMCWRSYPSTSMQEASGSTRFPLIPLSEESSARDERSRPRTAFRPVGRDNGQQGSSHLCTTGRVEAPGREGPSQQDLREVRDFVLVSDDRSYASSATPLAGKTNTHDDGHKNRVLGSRGELAQRKVSQ